MKLKTLIVDDEPPARARGAIDHDHRALAVHHHVDDGLGFLAEQVLGHDLDGVRAGAGFPDRGDDRRVSREHPSGL